MAKLVAISADAHGGISISPEQSVLYAREAHMLPLRVTEVAQAIIDFPVIVSRTPQGDLSLSALSSFQPQHNLFVKEDVWQSSFQSSAMKTYPVFLMRAEDGSPDPVLGVDEDSEALVKTGEGVGLFDKKGKLSLGLKQLQSQLIEDSRNTVHTFKFLEALTSLDLLRPVDLILKYADGQANRITGLSMIHEDNLQALSAESLAELRDKGYLPPIYAMLFSVLQLNALIRRHNTDNGLRPIQSINLEVSKDSRPV